MPRLEFVDKAIGTRAENDTDFPYPNATKESNFDSTKAITDVRAYVEDQIFGMTDDEKRLALPVIRKGVGECVGVLYSGKTDTRQRVDGNSVKGELNNYCKQLMSQLPRVVESVE